MRRLALLALLLLFASTATAVHRWHVAYRELARREHQEPAIAAIAIDRAPAGTAPVRRFSGVQPVELH